MRVLLANLLAGADRPRDINNLSAEESLVGRWRFCDDMLVDPDLLDAGELARLRRAQHDFVASRLTAPFICKTHDRFDGSVLGGGARRSLYLIRDPRDVAISLSHHSSIPLDHAIGQMTDAACHADGPMQLRYPLGDWAGHVEGWSGQDAGSTRVVRYEDLRHHTAATLSSVIVFLGGEATDAEIRRAVAHSALEELQRQEAARGFRESRPGQDRFFRSGRVGEWRDVMTPAQVEALEERFLPVMKRWGYGPSR
ncbi:hypothetical protein ASE22_20320 [Sphingomonas sp. Root720]|nr:hypothetical protein ASE22_20320 [Sphingomonas sp. Root720]